MTEIGCLTGTAARLHAGQQLRPDRPRGGGGQPGRPQRLRRRPVRQRRRHAHPEHIDRCADWLSCVGEPGSTCANTTGTGISTGYGVVVSPDGHNVYLTSITDKSVAEFDRNPTTGVLTQKASPNNCIAGPGGAPAPSRQPQGWRTQSASRSARTDERLRRPMAARRAAEMSRSSRVTATGTSPNCRRPTTRSRARSTAPRTWRSARWPVRVRQLVQQQHRRRVEPQHVRRGAGGDRLRHRSHRLRGHQRDGITGPLGLAVSPTAPTCT